MNTALVIGCGVSGLTSAIVLQEAGFSVHIITRDLPEDSTSIAAGAIWYGHGEGQMRKWALCSLKRFQDIAKIENSGVTIVRLYEVYPYRLDFPWYKHEIPFCEHIPPDDLPAGMRDGFVMDVPLVQPTRYLFYLMEIFTSAGGTIEQRIIQSLDDLLDEYPLIINCTGVGARQVANDSEVYPIRGQTALVDAPDVKYAYMDDESFTYIFPRGDGVLIGGIAQANNWHMTIDKSQTRQFIERCSQIEPSIRSASVLRELVGLRPGRFAVRLAKETRSDASTCIHNYGHGGVGYTLSWGCAEDVLALAR